MVILLSMKNMRLGLISVVVLCAACGRPAPRRVMENRYKTDAFVKQTPVRNQGRSSLCWAYAMLGTIESERLMLGDSVNLSVDYLARMLLKEQAREVFFAGGRKRVSLRGTASMALRLLERYGMLHDDSYHGRQVNYDVLERKVQLAASRSVSLSETDRLVDELLDTEVGFMPRFVFFKHAEYTPREFAHSVCLPHEYLSLTSFTHHPYGHSFVLEIPDNQYRDTFMNVPLDTLVSHVKRALQAGHPVCWEGDVSEPGFSFAQGVAMLPNETVKVTPAERQRQFETLKTTDDHCMVLVGLAHDEHGKSYYIAKNSWGKRNPFGGYMYLSDNYLRLKTVAVYMSQAAYTVR